MDIKKTGELIRQLRELNMLVNMRWQKYCL